MKEIIKLYIVHKWEMEKLRALIVDELNDANICEFIDLSGKINAPFDADESYLQEILLGAMIDADIIAILIPDPFYMYAGKRDKKADTNEFDYFMQEHMLIEFENDLALKPIVPLAFGYKDASEYAKELRSGPEVKRYNSHTSEDTVIPLPIDIINKENFAMQLKKIAEFEF